MDAGSSRAGPVATAMVSAIKVYSKLKHHGYRRNLPAESRKAIMPKFPKTLVVGGIIAVVYFLSTTMASRHTAALADGGPTITVGGPLPLPVSAEQHGAWNVALSGTPSVNIANSPSVKRV